MSWSYGINCCYVSFVFQNNANVTLHYIYFVFETFSFGKNETFINNTILEITVLVTIVIQNIFQASLTDIRIVLQTLFYFYLLYRWFKK